MSNQLSHAIPPGLWRDLDPTLPVLLLPVRLETRWGRRDLTDPATGQVVPGAMPVLRVRVYPDDISVARLGAASVTASETAAGQRFWSRHGATDVAAAPHDRQAAWEVFTREVGVERARHVALATRPGSPAPDGAATVDTTTFAWLLPDAWVVIGHSGDQRVLSGYVPVPEQKLPVGLPDLDPELGPAFDPEDPYLIADPALRWLTDFGQAQRQGMALTVDLISPEAALSGQHPAWLAAGLDTLVVFGVRGRAAADPQAEATALAALIDAHAADGDAGFLPIGTPTNNLPGTRSGWTSQPAAFTDYESVVGGAKAEKTAATGVDALRGLPGTTSGTALAAACGLAPHTFANLSHGSDSGLSHARQMATALYPVVLGEAIRTLQLPADPALLSADLVAESVTVSQFTAEHFADYVRGRGPLPALRIGRQPYGVLPVTRLSQYRPDPGDPPLLADLAALLRRLRPFWSTAVTTVPKLDRQPGAQGTVASTLVRILQQGPVPHPGAYLLQECQLPVWPVGPGTPLDVPAAAYGQILRPYPPHHPGLARELGLALEPYQDRDGAVGGQAIEPPDPWPQAEAPGDGLRELAVQLLRAPAAATGSPPTLRDLLIPRYQAGLITPVAASGSHHPEQGDAGGHRVASYLAALAAGRPLPQPPPDLLYHMVEQSLRIAAAPQPDGELLGRVRDGCLEPLTRRHGRFQQRAAGYLAWVAAYNHWVEAGEHGPPPVLPAGVAAQNNEDDPDDDPPQPWYELPGHSVPPAPSGEPAYPRTAEAVAALAAADLPDHEYVQLLGETVACASTRLDAWLTSLATHRLAQQRQQRPTGVQLGCWAAVVNLAWQAPDTVEGPGGWRAPDGTTEVRRPARQVGYVHAPSLAQASTAGVLRAAELSHDGDGSTLASLDLTSWRARTARDLLEAVGNGQPLGAVLGDLLERALGEAGRHECVARLRAAFPQHRTSGELGEPATGSDTVVPVDVVDGLEVWRAGPTRVGQLCPDGGEPLREALAQLDRAVEAVADTLVAEGVHELVLGRTELAAATFAALAEGERPPLELAVLRTPAAGVTISHRLLLALDPQSGVPGWQRSRPRARLATAAEGWAETVLGDPGGYRATVSGRDRTGAAVSAVVELAGLGLCALDVVVESAGAERDLGGGSPSGLVARLGAAVGVVGDLVVTDSGDGSWERLTALAGAVAQVLAGARPAGPADLAPPPEPEPHGATGSVGESAEAARWESVARELASVLDTLSQGIDAVIAATGHLIDDDQPVPDHLLEPFAQLGLPGSVHPPGAATAGAARIAVAAARTSCADIVHLLGEESAAMADTASPWPQRLLAACHGPAAAARMTALVGRLAGEPVVPVPPAESALTAHLLPASDPGPAALEEWLERISRVRQRAANYAELRWFTEALGAAPDPLRAAHLPNRPGQAWLGGPGTIPPEQRLAGTHAVIAGAPSRPGPCPVLVLDEWDELLPDPDVTTGLALHYQAPAARAPQTILLAVHPDPAEPWSVDLLDATIREALSLAQLRMVDHEDLAQVLPAGQVPLTYLSREEKALSYPWPQPLPPTMNPDLYDPWHLLRQIDRELELAQALWLGELERRLAKLLRGEPPDENEWDWLQRCFDDDLLTSIPYPPPKQELDQFLSQLTGRLAELEQLPPVLEEALTEFTQLGPDVIDLVGGPVQQVPEEMLVVTEESSLVTSQEVVVAPEDVLVTPEFFAANRVNFGEM